MNRRAFIRASTALLATTMLTRVDRIHLTPMVQGAQRAMAQAHVTYGRSPAMAVLPDIRALQVTMRAGLVRQFGTGPFVRTITVDKRNA